MCCCTVQTGCICSGKRRPRSPSTDCRQTLLAYPRLLGFHHYFPSKQESNRNKTLQTTAEWFFLVASIFSVSPRSKMLSWSMCGPLARWVPMSICWNTTTSRVRFPQVHYSRVFNRPSLFQAWSCCLNCPEGVSVPSTSWSVLAETSVLWSFVWTKTRDTLICPREESRPRILLNAKKSSPKPKL